MTRRLASVAVVTAVISMASPAFAATPWTKSGSGNGTAKATSIGTGNTVTAPATSTGSVTLSWTAKQIGGNDMSTYSVTRYPSSASTLGTGGTTITCPTSIVSHTVSCSYSESTAGTYKYTETPLLSSWKGGESGFSGTTTVTLASYTFAVSTIGTQTAGTAFGGFTVQLQANGVNTGTFNGNPYTGAHTVTFSGTAMAPSPNSTAATPTSTSLTFNNGVATVPANALTLYKAQSGAILTVTDTASSISGSSSTFAINSAGAVLGFGTACPSGSWANSQTWTSTITIPSDNYGNPASYATPGLSFTVALGGTDPSHWSLNTTTGPTSVTISSTGSPTGSFTVKHLDNGSSKHATITVSGPSGAGYTPVICSMSS